MSEFIWIYLNFTVLGFYAATLKRAATSFPKKPWQGITSCTMKRITVSSMVEEMWPSMLTSSVWAVSLVGTQIRGLKLHWPWCITRFGKRPVPSSVRVSKVPCFLQLSKIPWIRLKLYLQLVWRMGMTLPGLNWAQELGKVLFCSPIDSTDESYKIPKPRKNAWVLKSTSGTGNI